MTNKELYEKVQTACKAVNGARDVLFKTKLTLIEKQCFTLDNMPASILAVDAVVTNVAQSCRSIFDVALHLGDGSEVNLSEQDIKDLCFIICMCLNAVYWSLDCVETRIKDKIDAACLSIAKMTIAEMKSCFMEELDLVGK